MLSPLCHSSLLEAMMPLTMLMLLELLAVAVRANARANVCNVSGCAEEDVQGLLQLVKGDPSSCSAHSHCNELRLSGACCPTADGTYLYCCDDGSSDSHTATTQPSQATSATTSKAPRKKPTPDVTVPDHQTIPAAVQLECSGEGFLNCWTFDTESDPTHGYIKYASCSRIRTPSLLTVLGMPRLLDS